jgi:hypothetical protein
MFIDSVAVASVDALSGRCAFGQLRLVLAQPLMAELFIHLEVRNRRPRTILGWCFDDDSTCWRVAFVSGRRARVLRGLREPRARRIGTRVRHAGYRLSGIGGEDGKWGMMRCTQMKAVSNHYGE